jgi:hypothetical protein
MHGDSQVVQTGPQDDDDFSVILTQTVVRDDTWFDTSLDQYTEHSQSGIGHNPNVYLTVVTDAATLHGIDIGTFPKL